MLVELVVGYSFSALVLVADAYHLLNDLVAFIIQLYADEVSSPFSNSGTQIPRFGEGFRFPTFKRSFRSSTKV